MLNKVVLIGRLTRDPEKRYTPSGIAVTRFTLAVDRNFTNQQGEREADFIPITTWRNLAENCGKYLAKGRLVAVSGRIQTGSYETPEGQRRYTTDVVADDVRFLERMEARSDSGGGYDWSSESRQDDNQYDRGQRGYGGGAGGDQSDSSDLYTPIDIPDDELPF